MITSKKELHEYVIADREIGGLLNKSTKVKLYNLIYPNLTFKYLKYLKWLNIIQT